MSKLKSLLSRKFLLTVFGYVGAILVATGASDSTVKWVSILGALVINIVYIVIEGKIDWVRIQTAASKISEAVSDLADETKVEKNSEAIIVPSMEQSETAVVNQITTSQSATVTLTVDQTVANVIMATAEAIKRNNGKNTLQ